LKAQGGRGEVFEAFLGCGMLCCTHWTAHGRDCISYLTFSYYTH